MTCFVTLRYKWEIHTTLEAVQHERYSEVARVVFLCTFKTFDIRLNSKGRRTFRISVDTTIVRKQSLGTRIADNRNTYVMFNKTDHIHLM